MPPDGSGTPPTEPVRGAGAADERHSEPPDATNEHERFGPLQLTRTRKDDGRELIFFNDTRGPM